MLEPLPSPLSSQLDLQKLFLLNHLPLTLGAKILIDLWELQLEFVDLQLINWSLLLDFLSSLRSVGRQVFNCVAGDFWKSFGRGFEAGLKGVVSDRGLGWIDKCSSENVDRSSASWSGASASWACLSSALCLALHALVTSIAESFCKNISYVVPILETLSQMVKTRILSTRISPPNPLFLKLVTSLRIFIFDQDEAISFFHILSRLPIIFKSFNAVPHPFQILLQTL